MDDNESAAVFHVFFKRALNWFGPVFSVVVAHDDIIFFECRTEVVPLGLKLLADFRGGFGRLGLLALAQVPWRAWGARRGSSHIDLEQFGLFHLCLHVRRHGFPVVVVLSIDEQHTDLLSKRWACHGGEEQGGDDPFFGSLCARHCGADGDGSRGDSQVKSRALDSAFVVGQSPVVDWSKTT